MNFALNWGPVALHNAYTVKNHGNSRLKMTVSPATICVLLWQYLTYSIYNSLKSCEQTPDITPKRLRLIFLRGKLLFSHRQKHQPFHPNENLWNWVHGPYITCWTSFPLGAIKCIRIYVSLQWKGKLGKLENLTTGPNERNLVDMLCGRAWVMRKWNYLHEPTDSINHNSTSEDATTLKLGIEGIPLVKCAKFGVDNSIMTSQCHFQ